MTTSWPFLRQALRTFSLAPSGDLSFAAYYLQLAILSLLVLRQVNLASFLTPINYQ